MRLDKFLKVSRLIKRRTVAKEACDKDRVTINGRSAKAGSDVKEGDELLIRFGSSELKVRIVKISESVKKDDAAEMYEVIV